MLHRQFQFIALITISSLFMALLGCGRSVRSQKFGEVAHYNLSITTDTLSTTSCYFLVTVSNLSSYVLTVPPAYLPWNNLGIVIATPDGLAIPRSERREIRDWISEPTIIAPHTAVSQRISIVDLVYETAIPWLTNSELVVFWTYRLEPMNQPPLARTGGWLVIPKQIPR